MRDVGNTLRSGYRSAAGSAWVVPGPPDTINPTTGEPVKKFPLRSGEEVFTELTTAGSCCREDWWFRPIAERDALVGRAAVILREEREESRFPARASCTDVFPDREHQLSDSPCPFCRMAVLS